MSENYISALKAVGTRWKDSNEDERREMIQTLLYSPEKILTLGSENVMLSDIICISINEALMDYLFQETIPYSQWCLPKVDENELIKIMSKEWTILMQTHPDLIALVIKGYRISEILCNNRVSIKTYRQEDELLAVAMLTIIKYHNKKFIENITNNPIKSRDIDEVKKIADNATFHEFEFLIEDYKKQIEDYNKQITEYNQKYCNK